MSPGISFSARVSAFRPQSASEMSARTDNNALINRGFDILVEQKHDWTDEDFFRNQDQL
jgi:hypothetical protein